VRPDVLRWARESAGYSIREAATKIGTPSWRLEAAESGYDLLTFRQAERAADLYERPLASLFLPAPPDEEPQDAQFRRLPGAPQPPWPPNMRLLARRIRQRQDAARELYETLEESPPWTERARRFQIPNLPALPEITREVLGIRHEEQETWPDGFTALRRWREEVEELGVLVMQDGSMPVDVMRGFASIDAVVPAIVVNSKDDARARAFTIVHELGHLLLAANHVPVGQQTEPWCNEFAGAVLMPPRDLERVFSESDGSLISRVEEVARSFRVTPLAAAVRISRAGLAARADAEAVIAQIRIRGEGAASSRSGGDYYRNQIAGFGPGFIRLVFNALDTQVVTYPTASTLLEGVKVSNFDKLRTQLERRSDAA
jgi:Zn-dependent peptidase ImmA (M78 family)